jgi:ADP-heptose:LPS heptosyltransferase
MEEEGRGLSILVLRFGALGDILRTLPAVRLIRAGLPGSRVRWVVDEKWGAILDGHPDLDGILPFPRSTLEHRLRSPARWRALWADLRRWRDQLRSGGPHLALDFHGNLRSGLSTWLSGAEVRLGFSGHQQKEGNRLFATHRVPAGERRRSRIERNLDLVRALGLRHGPLPDGGLSIPEASEQEARRVRVTLEIGSLPYSVLGPGASRRQAYKRPPSALLADAARYLTGRGIVPVVVHGPGEESVASLVVEESGRAARLAPPTDLWTLTALIREARLFIGGDSGPLHLACAVGCPVVGLYGPTDPEVNGPWGVPHAVLTPPGNVYTGIKKKDRRLAGPDRISTDELERAVDRVLGGAREEESKP